MKYFHYISVFIVFQPSSIVLEANVSLYAKIKFWIISKTNQTLLWIFDTFLSIKNPTGSDSANTEKNKIDLHIDFHEKKNNDDDNVFDDMKIYLKSNRTDKTHEMNLTPKTGNFLYFELGGVNVTYPKGNH